MLSSSFRPVECSSAKFINKINIFTKVWVKLSQLLLRNSSPKKKSFPFLERKGEEMAAEFDYTWTVCVHLLIVVTIRYKEFCCTNSQRWRKKYFKVDGNSWVKRPSKVRIIAETEKKMSSMTFWNFQEVRPSSDLYFSIFSSSFFCKYNLFCAIYTWMEMKFCTFGNQFCFL